MTNDMDIEKEAQRQTEALMYRKWSADLKELEDAISGYIDASYPDFTNKELNELWQAVSTAAARASKLQE